MIAILAEKPSVAREIAAIAGANDKKEGYLSGNGYMVTWALGHLIQLALPEDYGATGFVREQLPILPEPFRLVPRQIKSGKGAKTDPAALKQLNIIKSVFDSCDRIIVATDSGREGCLIFRYIYTYLNCTKPFDRLWISSLTEKAIREGLQNLRPGSDYDNLYLAARARSEADWLIGVNSSRALSIAAGQGVFSLGRVQTPTLAMVCSRYLEHTGFSPVPYWELRLDTSYGGQEFSAVSKERITSRGEARELYEKQSRQETVTVQSIDKKQVSEEPPLLYDLTTLQKEANTKYGFSADKTLSVAQRLYESGCITYPRTGSRYISDDVFSEIPALIAKLATYKPFAAYAGRFHHMELNTRSVDDKKVTDHHALLITGQLPDKLSGDERRIYDMVAGRMLEAFSRKCVKDHTTILLECAGTVYTLKGSVTIISGWREVFGGKGGNKDKDEDRELPALTQGQELPVGEIQLLEKLTKPQPLHTEASLLAAMEAAGKNLESEEQRRALKDCGIGTPATRAAIIETLFSRDYMCRQGKALIPSEKGLAVYQAVKDMRIADVEMTGMWEETFAKIESGEADPGNFRKGIEVYATQVTGELLEATLSLPKPQTVSCPKCGNTLNFYPKVVKCADPGCGLMVFTSLAGKTLSGDILQTLLSGKQTATIKGFKGKTGKSFDAALVLDERYKIKFVFDNNTGKGKGSKSGRK